MIDDFQFPLWDTCSIKSFSIFNNFAFNSLYGIPVLFSILMIGNKVLLSIPFMGYIGILGFVAFILLILLSIPFMGYLDAIIKYLESINSNFQFPLWDTEKILNSTRKAILLLSIPFMGYIYSSTLRISTDQLLSIPFMGYFSRFITA